jgi:hypothetical protein
LSLARYYVSQCGTSEEWREEWTDIVTHTRGMRAIGEMETGSIPNEKMSEFAEESTLLDVLQVQDGMGQTHFENTTLPIVIEYFKATKESLLGTSVELWADVELFQGSISVFICLCVCLFLCLLFSFFYLCSYSVAYGLHDNLRKPASIERIISQLQAEAPLVSHFTCWEFHEYLSPLNPKAAKLYREYKAYYERMRRD